MKLKQATLYRFYTGLKGLVIFYLFYLIFAVVNPLIGQRISHTETATRADVFLLSLFFLFALSLLTLREEFKLFLQNGVSRKNIFLSNVIGLSLISLFISLIGLMLDKLFYNNPIYQVRNSFASMYGLNLDSGKDILLTLLLSFLICLFVLSIGLVISSAFQYFSRPVFMIISMIAFFLAISLNNITRFLTPEQLKHFLNSLSFIMGFNLITLQPHVSHLFVTLSLLSCGLLAIYNWFQRHQEISFKEK